MGRAQRLTAGSPDSTAALTGRGAGLRSGEYQIGLDAYDTEGFPAQISFYRDATFALGYSHYFDDAQRLIARADRTAEASDSAVVPSSADPGTVAHEQYGYDGTTSAPLLSSVASPIFGTSGNAASTITYNLEHDEVSAAGFGAGLEGPATYVDTRDTGGRLTSQTSRFSTSSLAGDPTAQPQPTLITFGSEISYFPDGRVSHIGNADGGEAISIERLSLGTTTETLTPGSHAFTYDTRGLLATQTISRDGTYAYAYDALGRNTELTFPDGHKRVQIYDDLGRITSRCYTYADPSLTRCYSAQYDAVGNPVQLTDPEGTDTFTYDALDRLTSVTRAVSGLDVALETYAYNALGALRTNAGVPMDHQRPRLAGGGNADAAVPATLDAQPVGLDAGGRVTSLQGAGFAWGPLGQVRRVDPAPPLAPIHFGVDTSQRRAWTLGAPTIHQNPEYYLYQGVNRVAAVEESAKYPKGFVQMGFLYDGVDHPLRVSGSALHDVASPPPPDPPTIIIHSAVPETLAYYELDLAGNVRRLRGPAGDDLGGYRYSAFGVMLEDTVQNVVPPSVEVDLRRQPLRWKGMWRFDLGGGVEVYDARARMWSPKLGTFLSVDEFAFHDQNSTLWGWPNQNPVRWSDPSGRSGWPPGAIDQALMSLEDAGFFKAHQSFTLGLLSTIPLFGIPTAPNATDIFGAAGIKSDPCSAAANIAGKAAGIALQVAGGGGGAARGAGGASRMLFHGTDVASAQGILKAGLSVETRCSPWWRRHLLGDLGTGRRRLLRERQSGEWRAGSARHRSSRGRNLQSGAFGRPRGQRLSA